MKMIVAATRNKNKIKEIEAITKEFGMNIISRDDAGVPPIEIEETGTTFEENSYLKAYEIMKLCGEITIADDSGLVVDCLDGAPGVYSARFGTFPGLWPEESNVADEEPASAGDNTAGIATGDDAGNNNAIIADGDDADNNAKLIELIKDVPYEKRTARFVSVITMVYPDGRSIVARGEVEGHIIPEETGDCGFGYDPLFIPDGYNETFGVLSPEVKNRISHRAKALEVLREKLERTID